MGCIFKSVLIVVLIKYPVNSVSSPNIRNGQMKIKPLDYGLFLWLRRLCTVKRARGIALTRGVSLSLA
jgi:hypothetical protein